MTSQDQVLNQIATLNVWRRNEERAPHKPLLILRALDRGAISVDRDLTILVSTAIHGNAKLD